MSKDKYPSIFLPQMEAIVYSILQIFFAMRSVLKIGEYFWIFPSFSWGIFGHGMCLDQLRMSDFFNIWWIETLLYIHYYRKYLWQSNRMYMGSANIYPSENPGPASYFFKSFGFCDLPPSLLKLPMIILGVYMYQYLLELMINLQHIKLLPAVDHSVYLKEWHTLFIASNNQRLCLTAFDAFNYRYLKFMDFFM